MIMGHVYRLSIDSHFVMLSLQNVDINRNPREALETVPDHI